MWRGPALSTLLLWLLLLSALHISADEDAFEIPETPQQQTQQWYSGLQLGLPFNPGLGSTADHFCDSQLVVLGVHGARTSIVTRLLTLLGMLVGRSRSGEELGTFVGAGLLQPQHWYTVLRTQGITQAMQ